MTQSHITCGANWSQVLNSVESMPFATPFAKDPERCCILWTLSRVERLLSPRQLDTLCIEAEQSVPLARGFRPGGDSPWPGDTVQLLGPVPRTLARVLPPKQDLQNSQSSRPPQATPSPGRGGGYQGFERQCWIAGRRTRRSPSHTSPQGCEFDVCQQVCGTKGEYSHDEVLTV